MDGMQLGNRLAVDFSCVSRWVGWHDGFEPHAPGRLLLARQFSHWLTCSANVQFFSEKKHVLAAAIMADAGEPP